MHILLIEDDVDLGRALQAALQLEGHSSTWLSRAADAPLRLESEAPDAVLLDQSLPDGDGHRLLTRWRGQGSLLPILVITARTALTDRLAGFDGGADDYVLKPFEMPELMARLRSVLRRSASQASDCWQLGMLTIEPRRRRVQLGSQELALAWPGRRARRPRPAGRTAATPARDLGCFLSLGFPQCAGHLDFNRTYRVAADTAAVDAAGI